MDGSHIARRRRLVAETKSTLASSSDPTETHCQLPTKSTATRSLISCLIRLLIFPVTFFYLSKFPSPPGSMRHASVRLSPRLLRREWKSAASRTHLPAGLPCLHESAEKIREDPIQQRGSVVEGPRSDQEPRRVISLQVECVQNSVAARHRTTSDYHR